MKFFITVIGLAVSSLSLGQTISSFINEVDSAGIVQLVRDLSGEDSTIVGGNSVLITNRVSASENDIAADYIKERLETYGIGVSDIPFDAKGRNIIGKITGTTNPDSIYLICAHYDAVGDHGADDNASGVAAVLEAARIMSVAQFENTVIFALWDEEEVGLKGARNYAEQATLDGDKIIAVLNLDMIAYDGDNDREFDIDVRDYVNSYQIRDDLLQILANHDIDLIANVIDPGTPNSDHAAFWGEDYSAVLVGEAWSNNDITPGYHTPVGDTIGLFNYSYFYQMVKLTTAYITTKAAPIPLTGFANQGQYANTSVFPNPVLSSLTIDCNGCDLKQFQIIDNSGSTVITEPANNDIDINTKSLKTGIYVIEFTDDQGATRRYRFLKQ